MAEEKPETGSNNNIEESLRRLERRTNLLLEDLRAPSRDDNQHSPSLPSSSTLLGSRVGSLFSPLTPLTTSPTNLSPRTPPRTIHRMASALTLDGTFSGILGEDPLEYIEELEIYGQKCEPGDEQARK